MAKIENKFFPDETIVKKNGTQILIIDFVDYTRNVYVFKTEYVQNLTRYKSFDIKHIDENFNLKR